MKHPISDCATVTLGLGKIFRPQHLFTVYTQRITKAVNIVKPNSKASFAFGEMAQKDVVEHHLDCIITSFLRCHIIPLFWQISLRVNMSANLGHIPEGHLVSRLVECFLRPRKCNLPETRFHCRNLCLYWRLRRLRSYYLPRSICFHTVPLSAQLPS